MAEKDGFLVHVVDDDREMRQALHVLLATREIQCRLYETAEAFLDASRSPLSICALIDVRLPGMNGLALINELGRRHIPHASIVISGHGDIPMAVAAMRAGAMHFIEKPFDPAMLLDVLEEARLRMHSLGDCARVRALTESRHVTLTPREKEVMGLLVAGLPSKLVARKLGISTRTAEHHRAAVMHKMGARTLSHLVGMAITLGLPTPVPGELLSE